MQRYPRDMHGHGPTPPDAAWPDPHLPGGARIALSLVLNYEEGGENCILHGDAASEAFLSDITGAQPWPGQRHANMESLYEYGARAGFWRLHRMLAHLPVTVFGIASALARGPAQLAAMQAAGWEIACHGLKWIEHKDMAEDDERAAIDAAIALHGQVTGTPPAGFYCGRSSQNTLRLAARTGAFAYLSDSYADDLPYWAEYGERDQLILPYTLDANDMRFAIQAGHPDGASWETYLRDAFDCLYREGTQGRPAMMSVGLHCRLAGRPGRAEALRRFLEHVAARHEREGGVWIATRAQIAAHWAATHPHIRRARPSEMDRETFVARFGSVFEHSPWVAERAFDAELGPAHDTATGLHAALARAFRAATDDERLGVLTAHPDLAGKLAAAGRLTPESTAEQAAAGLDLLTDAERETFRMHNQAYVRRHGFPFILAVRDHDKPAILAAMKTRIAQNPKTERAEACRQVERIAYLRLQDMMK